MTTSKGIRSRTKPPHARIDWSAQPLGKVADAVVARALGVSYRTVANARIRRGIPSWRATRPRVPAMFPIDMLPRLLVVAGQEARRRRDRIEHADAVQIALLALLEACARGFVEPPREWGSFARVIMRNALGHEIRAMSRAPAIVPFDETDHDEERAA